MILLSVGTQFPFDRLVKAVDDWAVRSDCDDVVGQIGPSQFVARKIKCFSFLNPSEFRDVQERADIIVAHAGMGSILTALEFGKPIVIMPRDHTRNEHRNAHQLATASRFRNMPGIHVAMDEAALSAILDDLDRLVAANTVSKKAPEAFTARLKAFVESV